jgi:hypothetical protein
MMGTKTAAKKKTAPAVPSTHVRPEILAPAHHSKITESPLIIEWTPNQANVRKWWLSVGHAPGLSDYFYDEYDADDELSATVKIELTGGDVYIQLEYEDETGEVHTVRPIIECSTIDKTQHPSHSHKHP